MSDSSDAYAEVDRFLRNNLDDTDYAHYSAQLEAVRLSQPIEAALAAAPQEPVPVAWTVFNGGGAVVCDGLTLHEMADYMTVERMARGWNAVACIDIRTDEQLQAMLSAAQPSAEPTTECTTCGATVVRVTGVYDYPPPGEELVRAARDALRLIDQYAARDDITHIAGIVDVPVALRRALDAGEAKGGGR